MHFTNELAEAQRSQATYPKPHSQEMELEFGPGPADSRAFHSPVLFSPYRDGGFEHSIVLRPGTQGKLQATGGAPRQAY